MKRWLCLLLLVLSHDDVWSQQPFDSDRYKDSLYEAAQSEKETGQRARADFLLADFLRKSDSTLSAKYYQEGLKLANGNPLLSAIGKYYDAVLGHTQNPGLTESKLLRAISELSSIKATEAKRYEAMSWARYGDLQKQKDDHKTYIDVLLNHAIPLAAQAHDSNEVGRYYMEVAIGFKNTLDYQQAAVYLDRSMAVLSRQQAPAHYRVPVYHTAAENFILQGQTQKAAAPLDSMRKMLQPFPDADVWVDYFAANTMYLNMSLRFAEALAEVDKGIAFAHQKGKTYPEQRLLLQKFYVLFNKGDFTKARDVMLDLLAKKEILTLATNRIQMYYGLALTYDSLHDMSNAYHWMSQYALLSDSFNRSKVKMDMNALEARYQSNENEKKIAVLQADKLKAQLKAKSSRMTNWLLVSFSLALMSAFLFLYFFFINNRKLALQKEINYRQKMKELEQTQQLATTEAILEGEERERRRMARDLHDGLGGMLAGVKIKLSAVSKSKQLQQPELNNAIGQLDHSVSELRRIARNMMPESLMRFGLDTALRDLCESLMNDRTRISYESYNIENTVDMNVQIVIYRIIQEALSNAIRHADAKHVLLQCSQNEETFFITVEDDGKGFDLSLMSNKGIGLSNIESRVNYLKGKTDIISSPGEGTTINIEVNAAHR